MSLNPKDFGATGDGVTDDTAAFEACAAAVALSFKRVQPPGGSGEAMSPRVIIPNGHYRLSRAINWIPSIHIAADGYAIIQSAAPTFAFGFKAGYMVHIEGLTFLQSAGTAIHFTNNNANGAFLKVLDCRFQRCGGPSIVAQPVLGPFFSSHVIVDHCKFESSKQAIVTWADVNTIRDCWMQWSDAVAGQNSAFIDLIGGRLNFQDTMLVPVFDTHSFGNRWIRWKGHPLRNGGSGIFCDRVQFHGEGGGLPPVQIEGPPDAAYPFQGSQVVFRGCQLSCGATAWGTECAAIHCCNGLPQTVFVDGCSGLIGPGVLMNDMGGLETALAGLSNRDLRIRIALGANCFWPLTPPVPTCLQPYVRTLAD